MSKQPTNTPTDPPTGRHSTTDIERIRAAVAILWRAIPRTTQPRLKIQLRLIDDELDRLAADAHDAV